ncbi:MAG: PH domain-containing protein, partial [Lysinibacillus sp.]
QTIGNQITIVYRNFSKTTFIAQKQRVQTMYMGQSIFQKRRQIASVEINVKSGAIWSGARASHLNQEDAEQLMDWYQYK